MSVVTFDAEAWGTPIEHEPEDIPVVPPDLHSSHLDRGDQVERILRRSATRLRVFGLTKDGHPKHPLYLPKTTQLTEWT